MKRYKYSNKFSYMFVYVIPWLALQFGINCTSKVCNFTRWTMVSHTNHICFSFGHGQWSRWTNSRWLRKLGYSCRTRRMSQEAQRKLAQREAMTRIGRVHTWSKFANFPVKFCFQTTGKEERQLRGTICNIFEVRPDEGVPLAFWETVRLFSAELHVPYKYLTSVYLIMTLSQKALRPALHALSIL